MELEMLGLKTNRVESPKANRLRESAIEYARALGIITALIDKPFQMGNRVDSGFREGLRTSRRWVCNNISFYFVTECPDHIPTMPTCSFKVSQVVGECVRAINFRAIQQIGVRVFLNVAEKFC